MDLIRFYCNPITGLIVELLGQEAKHLSSVRRLAKGDKVELFDGLGKLAVAVIQSANNRKAVLKIEDIKIFPAAERRQLVIAVSFPKGERFDWLIGKCTELGVGRITPVIFERTVKQPKNPEILDRWNRLTIAAAKQCRRLFLPQIDEPMILSEALQVLKRDYPQADFLIGSPDIKLPSLINRAFNSSAQVAFVGPEGGLTGEEEKLLKSSGIEFVRLTDTILRVETAAMAFASTLTAMRDAKRK